MTSKRISPACHRKVRRRPLNTIVFTAASQVGRSSRRGVSLVEVICVIGVMGVLASFAFPLLRGANLSARQVTATSNVRQLAVIASQYASDFKGFVPVLFPLNAATQSGGAVRVNFRDSIISGRWFDNAFALDYLLTGSEASILRDPAAPAPAAEAATAPESDFKLAACLYADATYWRPGGEQQVSQWQAQRLDLVRFPSQKGIVSATRVWTAAQGQTASMGYTMACCIDDVPSAAAWGDHSASMQVKGKLRPGVANSLNPLLTGPLNYDIQGVPIDETADGIFGRDR